MHLFALPAADLGAFFKPFTVKDPYASPPQVKKFLQDFQGSKSFWRTNWKEMHESFQTKRRPF